MGNFLACYKKPYFSNDSDLGEMDIPAITHQSNVIAKLEVPDTGSINWLIYNRTVEINSFMTRRLPLVLILIVIGGVLASGQSRNIDSLKQVLTQINDDSLKVRTYVRLSNSLGNKDFGKANEYSNQALKIAETNNWNWARSLAYINLGYIANSVGNFQQSLEYNNKALKIDLLTNDTSRISLAYNNVGNDYIDLGEYEEAYFYTEKSYEFAKASKDTLGIAVALHNLARIYSRLSRLDLALEHFDNSSKMSEAVNDVDGPVYNNLEIGNAYLFEGDPASAKNYLNKARQLNNTRNLINLTPKIYQSIGSAYFLSKDYDKAILYFDSANTHYRIIKNVFGEAETNLGKSKVLTAQKSFDEATRLAVGSLNTAKVLEAQRLLYDTYLVLSKINELQGDFKNALIYTQHALESKDSLTNIDMMSQVFENEYQMRSQKKDLEIANLMEIREQSMGEIRRQQFIRNIIAVIFALTIVLLYSVYKSGRRKVEINELLMKHQEETDRRTKELEELNKVKDKFFSIISHDLRSPINSLAGLLDLMEKGQIRPEELPTLTKEMRVQFNHTKNLINNLLDWTLLQMNKVAIRKEKLSIKTILDDNIRLLSSMSTKQTTFLNEVGDDIYALADNNMINLIFRNLILNGIKFTDNGGVIKINASREGNEIKVSVSDNGVGISEEIQSMLFEKTTGYSTRGTANEKGTGLGLILCKEFIERNGGKIWLQSEIGKGSTFHVTIPAA